MCIYININMYRSPPPHQMGVDVFGGLIWQYGWICHVECVRMDIWRWRKVDFVFEKECNTDLYYTIYWGRWLAVYPWGCTACKKLPRPKRGRDSKAARVDETAVRCCPRDWCCRGQCFRPYPYLQALNLKFIENMFKLDQVCLKALLKPAIIYYIYIYIHIYIYLFIYTYTYTLHV